MTDGGTEAVNYAAVQYSAAVTGVTALTSADNGNNTNWTFNPSTLTWTGAIDTDWDKGGNWDEGYVPNAGDDVVVAFAGSQPATLAGDVTVNDLTISVNAGMDTAEIQYFFCHG